MSSFPGHGQAKECPVPDSEKWWRPQSDLRAETCAPATDSRKRFCAVQAEVVFLVHLRQHVVLVPPPENL